MLPDCCGKEVTATVRPQSLPIALVVLAAAMLALPGNAIAARHIPPAVVAAAEYQFTQDWVTPNSGQWREQLRHLKGAPNVHALEIGSFEGRSALWFLENILTHPTATITCVDVFADPGYEDRFDHNIKVSAVARKVKKVKGPSQIMLRQLKLNSYDFIYIDGSHIAIDVLIDAVLSWDLLKPGGIIIFDDYLMGENEQPNIPGVQRANPWALPRMAIDAFLQVFRPYLELQHRGYQVIVRKNRKM